jgi:Xaa-Pro aminopeptidase
MLDQSVFADRRRAVLDQLQPGEAMLLFGAHEHLRNGDAEYRYRQASDLLYLCGWEDPEVAVLLRADSEQPFVVFCQEKDPEREVWTGIRSGTVGAKDTFGADAAFPWGQLQSQLGTLLIGVHTLYYAAGVDPVFDAKLHKSLGRVRRKARDAFKCTPDAFIHPGRLLHAMRLYKTPAEVDLLRKAAEITVVAHSAAMAAAAPGVHEYELDALVDYTFRKHGGNGPGYTTIVGGGANACILHYITNREPLNDGDLVLIDAGCEYEWYTADVTRTFPVNGTFSPAQREVYQVVLDAQLACIDACRVGSTFMDVHDVAIRVLTQGMVALGLLEGDVDALIEAKDYKRYYMHGTSHWLGMDVHDVGTYVRDGGSQPLEPGILLTVEPGLYIPPDDASAPERLRGIGVRIEDDVLITDGDPDVLTGACPKTIDDVEAACRV